SSPGLPCFRCAPAGRAAAESGVTVLMMSRILSGLFLVFGLPGLAIEAQATPPIAAYYDGGMPVSQIPAAQISDLIYAFGEPNDAGVCIPVTADQSATFAALRK